MELKRYDLAKQYIVYRYTRTLVRKQNTTDESILGLIRRNGTNELKEENSNNYLASKQRNYIAGEVSQDLTKRLLLPEKITKADEEGVLHFHNADYFIQPMINNSYINLKALLQNGVEINEYKVNEPANFTEACQTLLDIILDVANNQYGVQNVDISCLGEYLKNATEEELTNSLQFLKQHLNTIMIAGKLVHIKFLINSEEKNRRLKDKIELIELENNKNIFVEIIDKNENILGQFDQGKVSINLVQAALVSDGNAEAFYSELKDRLEICKEALMCKHYALLGTSSDISPILWQSGGIATLEKGEKIDAVLTNGISTLSLGYIGLEECTKLIQLKDGTNIKGKIMQIMLEETGEWTKETGIKFILDSRSAKKTATKFLNIDKEKFGIVKNINDKEHYEV